MSLKAWAMLVMGVLLLAHVIRLFYALHKKNENAVYTAGGCALIIAAFMLVVGLFT
jgi:hypothetical protein